MLFCGLFFGSVTAQPFEFFVEIRIVVSKRGFGSVVQVFPVETLLVNVFRGHKHPMIGNETIGADNLESFELP